MKIFGIGLSKTGTTSLNRALEILGYRSKHWDLGLKSVDHYDAVTDIPAADAFADLDRRYPGSKFIYTVREREPWLRSCLVHRSREGDDEDKVAPEAAELRKRLYGTYKFDRDLYAAAYERHDRRVRSYFAQRPGDLLIINLCQTGNHWKPLCAFLGKPIPARPFPRANTRIKATARKHWRRLIYSRAGTAVRTFFRKLCKKLHWYQWRWGL